MLSSDNPQIQLAHDYVQYTGQHIFLTGKAGTGKTTFLRNLKAASPKRMIVVAPTGVAAINAGGVTIHSFFQLGFGPQVGELKEPVEQMRYNRDKINIIRSMDLLVIDEISMVRSDLLDAIDGVLRRFKDHSKPFGGVQLLMIGDLQQLSPVVRDEDWSILRQYYDSVFFFSSKALRETSFVSIELTHVYRQQDDRFIDILNKVRENKLDQAALQALNNRYIPNFKPKDDEGYITLCTHNVHAQRINEKKLTELKTDKEKFKAKVEGNFPEYSYPTEYNLILKEGAQVMFVKNDLSKEKLFYNGKIGTITRIHKDAIFVKCPDDYAEIKVTPLQWENYKYSIDEQTNEIKETLEGSFTQYPLKLAWAITIHKSQGLTFEHAIIDAEASFAHGQVYVALSRCKTLEGMVLSTPISSRSIVKDGTVSGFIEQIEENQPDEEGLSKAKLSYQHELLAELFRFYRTRYYINSINKIIDDNASTIPEIISNVFRKMFISAQEELVLIAEKFHSQIGFLLKDQPDVELNEGLQERICKASSYFSEKLQSSLIDELTKVDVEVDNKAVRKQLEENVSKLLDEVKVKKACLDICKDGFKVKDLLDTRAAAVIEKSKAKEPKKYAPVNDNTDIENPQLYGELRAWRTAKADEIGVPVYLIFSQKALLEMVTYLPSDVKALKQINGMGVKKVNQYGAEILEIINNFRLEYGIEPQDVLFKEEKEEKAPKVDTKQLSFDLFKEGKDIKEIAQERGMTAQTIENHLAYFIEMGDLDISLFVTDEKLDKITSYFEKAGNRSLSPAKEALGNDFSYTELKMTLKHLDYLNNQLN